MNIPLSKLVASRKNPRRVKPERDAHQRLVASIRAHGLLEPLIVRPDGERYEVIAGHRRLAALRVVHHDEPDQKIPCVVKKVDSERAEELSVAENFIREPMHPLDEAEAFARMASEDRKGIEVIAAEFGVGENYVRQRMKLAGLSRTVKVAYRSGTIDTVTAQEFAAVSATRQDELWEQMGGAPRHAEQVRAYVKDGWIEASHALFDVAALPPETVSTDLFRQRVLIERSAFLQAQVQALESQRMQLLEDGWAEVVIADRGDVQSRLHAMDEPTPAFTKAEKAKLDKLAVKREALESSSSDEDDRSEEWRDLEQQEDSIYRDAAGRYDEPTRSRATMFLVCSADGRVEREVRVPRSGVRGSVAAGDATDGERDPALLTANDLTDRQRAAFYTHEAIAVRHAVAGNAVVRKRLLVLALHDKVSTDALAIRFAVNATTQHANSVEGFQSATVEKLTKERAAIDPFKRSEGLDENAAYRKLVKLSEDELDSLIAVLTVTLVTGHSHRQPALLATLGAELCVSVRDHWTPDAEWLAGYKRIQLADLIGTLRGPAHGSAALGRKKSELVEELASLFTQATDDSGGPDDPELRDRLRHWLPGAKRD